MIAEDDAPMAGSDRNMLGLREGEATLSVYADFRFIIQPIRPKAVPNHKGQPGGNAETVLFAIDEAELAQFGLKVGALCPKTTHGPIEASDECDRDELHRRIIRSREKWKKV